MKKTPLRLVIGAALLLSLTACGLFETRGRVVGTVSSFGTLPQVDMPGEVRQGESFTATIITQGGGCMEQGETEIDIQGLRAEITPYDYEITPPFGALCPLYGQDYTHTATLTFAEKGTATVSFYGRDQLSSGITATTVTRTVEVR